MILLHVFSKPRNAAFAPICEKYLIKLIFMKWKNTVKGNTNGFRILRMNFQYSRHSNFEHDHYQLTLTHNPTWTLTLSFTTSNSDYYHYYPGIARGDCTLTSLSVHDTHDNDCLCSIKSESMLHKCLQLLFYLFIFSVFYLVTIYRTP